MEVGLPWSDKLLQEDPVIQPIITLIRQLIFEHRVKIEAQLMIPDREYSHRGYTRVFYYRRPQGAFAKFEKNEFLVPDAEVGAFMIRLLKTLFPDSAELPDLQSYRQPTSQIRELMVCTDGSVDIACGRFGNLIYRQLRCGYAAVSNGQLRVWRVSHFGGHQFAPTLADWPLGQFWGHLSPEVLDLLVWRKGAVTGLRSFYRGWSALTRFEQIAEREIWMQEGWAWLDYHKAGQVLAMDEANQEWAEVRIDFAAPDGSVSGAYEARVEVSGSVMTAWNSGDEQSLEEVKQYRVTRLDKEGV